MQRLQKDSDEEMRRWPVVESPYVQKEFGFSEMSKLDTYVKQDSRRAGTPVAAPPKKQGTNTKCGNFSYKSMFNDLWFLKQAL